MRGWGGFALFPCVLAFAGACTRLPVECVRLLHVCVVEMQACVLPVQKTTPRRSCFSLAHCAPYGPGGEGPGGVNAGPLCHCSCVLEELRCFYFPLVI